MSSIVSSIPRRWSSPTWPETWVREKPMSNTKAAKEKPKSNTEAAKQKPVFTPSTGNSKRGIDVLRDPSINKSTGFTEAERQALGLVGLVPDVTESMETQLNRVLLQLKQKATDLDRFIHLM